MIDKFIIKKEKIRRKREKGERNMYYPQSHKRLTTPQQPKIENIQIRTNNKHKSLSRETAFTFSNYSSSYTINSSYNTNNNSTISILPHYKKTNICDRVKESHNNHLYYQVSYSGYNQNSSSSDNNLRGLKAKEGIENVLEEIERKNSELQSKFVTNTCWEFEDCRTLKGDFAGDYLFTSNYGT